MSQTPLRLDFVKTPAKNADTAVIGVFADKKLSESAKLVDDLLGGILQHQLKQSTAYKANAGHTMSIALPPRAPYTRIVLLGLGDKDKFTPQVAETAGGRLVAALKAYSTSNAVVLNISDLDAPKFKDAAPEVSLALGARLGTYEFEHYKTAAKKDKAAPVLKGISFLSASGKDLTKTFKTQDELAESIFLTRNLVNEPPNRLYPESFAKVIEKTLKPLGVKVEILKSDQLKKLGMGCMIAVGQASENPPCLVTMSWPGKAKAGKKGSKKLGPIGLVGKGITFDTGGLSLKPYEGMLDMKCDMAGAAAVVGAMRTLALRKCSVPVVATVALAENSVSDEAVRPSDIVTSYSGKTVEILNTDAEGRLVLADALTYIQKKHNPRVILDLATLTGAIMIALGLDYCGVFANDDKVWKDLDAASAGTGEQVWRMPVNEAFRREMDSPFADIKNVGNGRYGGSSTAAAFLSEFIDAGRPWAHLDIAGVATHKGGKPTNPKTFATGWGVRLLNEYVRGFE